ncbi:MAG: response regulator transcription factor [Caldilineaceae bacterium]
MNTQRSRFKHPELQCPNTGCGFKPWRPLQPPIRLLVVTSDLDRDLASGAAAHPNFLYSHLPSDYQVTFTGSSWEAIHICINQALDVIIIDVAERPESGSHQLCLQLRQQSAVPIILVGREQEREQLLQGLQAGADHFLTKPFTLQELLARIHATLWRRKPLPELAETLMAGDIIMNTTKQEVYIQGEPVALTPVEYRLLNYMMRNPDRTLDKDEILRMVWGYSEDEDFNFLRVAIARLRKKIEARPGSPQYLKTVNRRGYRFCANTAG